MPKKNFISLVELQKSRKNEGIVPEVKEKGIAGRPDGSVENIKTITAKTREEAKKKFIKRGRKNLDKLFNALLSAALGEQFLFKKNKKTGFFDKVTDEEEIRSFLDNKYGSGKNKDDYEGYYITTEKPNIKALTDLLDRFVGKAINFDEMPEDVTDLKKKDEKKNELGEMFSNVEAEIFARFKTNIKKSVLENNDTKKVIDITKKQG